MAFVFHFFFWLGKAYLWTSERQGKEEGGVLRTLIMLDTIVFGYCFIKVLPYLHLFLFVIVGP
jgi:hypothetical protein